MKEKKHIILADLLDNVPFVTSSHVRFLNLTNRQHQSIEF